MFSGVVGILRVGFERNLGRAQCALDIEPEDLDPIVILALDGLLSCIKLLALVDVLSTCVTPPTCKD